MYNAKFAASFVAFALISSSGAVCAQTINDRVDQSFGSGYIKASAVVMKRSDPNDGTIVANNPGGAPYIAGDDFDFEFEPGFDGAIGFYFTPNNAIEIRTLQFGTSADLSAITPGNLAPVSPDRAAHGLTPSTTPISQAGKRTGATNSATT
jgi:hypothetical protein